MATNKEKTNEQLSASGSGDAAADAEKLLADARAQAENILAEAQGKRDEAEKVLAQANDDKERAATALSEAQSIKASAEEASKFKASDTASESGHGEEMVPVRLFKDNDKYKDDVFVAVNGKSWQIKRGETVYVPTYVADVLEQSMKQDTATASMIERQSAEYEAEAAARHI